MADLVQHLRESATDLCYPDGCCYAESMVKAADEIGLLRAALKPFADALTWAEAHASQPYDPADLLLECRWFVTLYEFSKARAALTTPEVR